MQFVPRVNLAAMYEILGVNVVDTFPQSIAAEFRRSHRDRGRIELLSLSEVVAAASDFDPDQAFLARTSEAGGEDEQSESA